MPISKEYRLHEIPDNLYFYKTENGLIKIVIDNEYAEAEIYLHGANLTHFQPKGEEAVIFNGKKTIFAASKTVHAGIPICWPWFGPHPTESTKPQHGFARDMLWQLKNTRVLGSGETEVVLTLIENAQSLELWPHSFELELTFTIGRNLSVSHKTTNTSKLPFTLTQALHSYFFIGDIESAEVRGVEGTPFVDYVDGRKEKTETASLHVSRTVNRVYIPTQATCRIIDPLLKRTIIIEKEGSDSTTIWNPWQESGIHDLPGDAYRKFLCIETTNALSDAKSLQPGESCMITQKVSVQKH
ncbi:D-hexose-6-phosphate mutarotase [Sulfurimonas sp. HSL3-7]|uniref:D-hexose-6-phosphate mutarotase n=1 Tax=Sulfonitrofixus jiaomeiensis TaxID=3131938 RepID=UPI0031F748FC